MREYLFPLEQIPLDYPFRKALQAYGARLGIFALCVITSLAIVAGVGFLVIFAPAIVISATVIIATFIAGRIVREALREVQPFSAAVEGSTHDTKTVEGPTLLVESSEDTQATRNIELRVKSGDEIASALELDDDIARIREIEARIESEKSLWFRGPGPISPAKP